MKTAQHPAVNDCPEGGKHSFILGKCWNCGLSIRVHKERIKEKNRQRWHQNKND